MPMYEFHCDACHKSFDHMTTMSQRDAAVACPHCSSKKTGRKLSVVGVGTNAAPGTTTGGHTHSGMCGCGKMRGSCGSN
jgi:putative FmdB family regulatory protein